MSFKVCINITGNDLEKIIVKFKQPGNCAKMQVGATSMSVLRSLWQAYWLHENWNTSSVALEQLAQSHLEMEDRFEDFIQQLNGIGWDTLQINLEVPREISLDELNPI